MAPISFAQWYERFMKGLRNQDPNPVPLDEAEHAEFFRKRREERENVQPVGTIEQDAGGGGSYLGNTYRELRSYLSELPDADDVLGPGMTGGEFFSWSPFAYEVTKPHQKIYNSCTKIKNDLGNCMLHSPCFQSGADFQECMQSNDINWVTQECYDMRFGYHQCRRDIHRRNEVWQFGNKWSN
ncbi:unnamed protein product [Amoebophrya sp. A25]|nr:unnamed protein product [Amoebophrya sp. A25]|eukprot:GSA25T00010119001.1